MPLGASLVLSEWLLRPLPGFRINDQWHRDGNPLARWPPRPALTIARHAVFATTRAIRLVHIGCLSPIVIGLPLVERVAEDLDNTPLGPTPVARLAREDPLRGEPLLDGVGTELLLHTLAIDQADDLGFGVVDDQMLRRCGAFPDRRVAIGGIAPVDPSLPGGEQPPPPGAFLNERPLVLKKITDLAFFRLISS
jgi:hypothetical protein